MKKATYIKHIMAPILALLILCSSIGINSYARFCSCSGKAYHSIFVQNEGDCCKKDHQPKLEQKHSCCSKSASSCEKPTEDQPEQKKKNCCDTEIELLALDLDATLDLSSEVEANVPFIYLLTSEKSFQILVKSTVDFEYEEENRKFFQAQAPPPLRTNERLQALQRMRC